MKEIKAKRTKSKYEKGDWFDPNYGGDGVLRCCCGFELVLESEGESENTYRCTGGRHMYRFSADEAFFDKFGNLLIKPKEDENDKGTKI